MSKVHAFRLLPDQDLKKEIERYVKDHDIKAGWMASCVGSLTRWNIRFANQPKGSTGKGHFEIVGLTGTVSVYGSHLHISISDDKGQTLGGHLLEDNIIYSTAEIVIQETEDFIFSRQADRTTQWKELQIKRRGS
jgi:hypothetical protein